MRRSMMMIAAAATLAGGNAPAQTPAPSSWADKVTLKGDVRYRYEMIDDETKSDERQRDRIRARLSAEAKANDTLKAVVGLSSGDSKSVEPTSSNQTLGDAFNRKAVYLELAYFDWALAGDNLALSGGKMKNPFINVDNLIWDSDVNPEGAALKAWRNLGKVELMANAGYLWIKEYDASAAGKAEAAEDVKMFPAQVAAKLNLSEEASLTVGGTYYAFDNIQGTAATDLNYKSEPKAFGNSTEVSGSSTNYANDFVPVEGFAKLLVWVAGVPVDMHGQYVVNTEADAYDTGYLAGVTVGRAKNPKTVEVGYNYSELEKDCVLGALTDSDRLGGGTDGNGHTVYTRYQIARNWQVGATYFKNEKTISDSSKTTDYDRLQVDLVASF